MATCPAGHRSQANDYCDTCGLVIGGAPATGAVPDPAYGGAAHTSGATTTAPPGSGAGSTAGSGSGGCPVCGAGRDGRFCEECGYDFELAEAMPEVALEAAAGSDSPVAGGAPAEGGSAAEGGASAVSQGFDIEMELARAEDEARAAQAASAEASRSTAAVPDSPAAGPDLPGPGSSGAAASQSPVQEGSAPERAFQQSPEGPGADPHPLTPPSPIGSGFAELTVPRTVPGGELSLVVHVDREYYDAQVERGDIIAADFPFPKYAAERRFSFPAGPVRIGRASATRGLSPEIDLTGPPLDPAVSHLHAQLLRHDEGWVVVDLGSANGTRLNESAEPLEAETEIPVKRGDRIHLGVWTTIVVQ